MRAGCLMSTFSPLCGEKSPERSEGDEGWLIASERRCFSGLKRVGAARLKTDPLRCAPLRPAAARQRLRRVMGGFAADLYHR